MIAATAVLSSALALTAQVYGEFRPGDVTAIRDPQDEYKEKKLTWSGAVIVFSQRDYDALSRAIIADDLEAIGEILTDYERADVLFHGDRARVVAIRRKATIPAAQVEMIDGQYKGKKGWVWLDTLEPKPDHERAGTPIQDDPEAPRAPPDPTKVVGTKLRMAKAIEAVNPKEALSYYREVIEFSPYSPEAREAQARLVALSPKFAPAVGEVVGKQADARPPRSTDYLIEYWFKKSDKKNTFRYKAFDLSEEGSYNRDSWEARRAKMDVPDSEWVSRWINFRTNPASEWTERQQVVKRVEREQLGPERNEVPKSKPVDVKSKGSGKPSAARR